MKDFLDFLVERRVDVSSKIEHVYGSNVWGLEEYVSVGFTFFEEFLWIEIESL